MSLIHLATATNWFASTHQHINPIQAQQLFKIPRHSRRSHGRAGVGGTLPTSEGAVGTNTMASLPSSPPTQPLLPIPANHPLPAPETSEQALLASFKAAALSVTQLYKDSQKHQRAEYAKGYETGLQDILSFISSHPDVLAKQDQGQTEDEIRHNTTISVDDMVTFASSARWRNQQQQPGRTNDVGGNQDATHHPHLNQHQFNQQQQQQQQQAQYAQQRHDPHVFPQ